MRLNDASVFTGQRDQRNGFWRGKGEVVKNPPVRRRLAILDARGVQPLRQSIARGRMLIFTKPEKFIGPNLAGQSQPFTTLSKPFPCHLLPFIIVITNAKMFLKVFFRVFQIVLRLGSDHTQTLAEPTRDFMQTLQVCVPFLW